MRTIIFILFTSCILATGFAQQDYTEMNNVKLFKSELEKQTASIKSIEADFLQNKHMKILTRPLQSKGVIRYKAPNKVRWTYREPYKYDIILNGNEIIINDDGNVNAFSVNSSKMFSEMNDLIVNSVQGNVLDESRFKLSYFENSENYKVNLIPIDKEKIGAFFSEIVIYFNKTDYSVKKVEMYEPGGDHTEIVFQNKEFNSSISSDVFSAK
ncbi:outer membrane lipoprotein carrier protein LolA [Mangrovivirga sp. M17]|uniref:Outer membrane lipoprotein carrier protein LolA n=1 Tax=Mangrovivirga halotolerans TaxID=2993936 RepID=A0ABT3RV27_9BACT|nr:outer membrane lipoprotein carrier protein LolA [Mangrovivirga halotolerans]MCX2745371.1 outer membrane lipoprotein carrier protein LolA [Mangrovivirga halotolerans]